MMDRGSMGGYSPERMKAPKPRKGNGKPGKAKGKGKKGGKPC